jgi:hypothetical protein
MNDELVGIGSLSTNPIRGFEKRAIPYTDS